ncbi:MBL fold metallo-hydrolase [Alteromonas gilva]|uniref:MBL fold metallo-hydrolase n=1 Tax=Alteromonas gilva TaxID=2987522 RepID=A0ABT5L609_9ALTE|nr:MBL fold metallo-hydrolase [Alteromonas gilva]MDC8832469.1 MBL fold metallo-hydrolase [Alteromonas gilva]
MTRVFKMIGTGSSDSSTMFNTNAAVMNDTKAFLIDCGLTVKSALNECGIGFDNISGIFISHVHGDHVFGLERVGYEYLFRLKTKVPLYIKADIYHELWDQTLKGSMGRIGEGEATLEDFFDVRIIQDNRFTHEGIHYEVFPVRHTPGKPCFGVCINDKILYTADTLTIPDILNAYRYTYCFHDVSLQEGNPVHANLSALMEYPQAVKQKIYLMSYSDDWKEYEHIVSEHFAGFAEQGKSVEL